MRQLKFLLSIGLISGSFTLVKFLPQTLSHHHMEISEEAKYGLHGSLNAKEGKTDELVDILLKASDLVSDFKGCRIYIVSKDLQDDNVVWVTEVWDSKEAHENSLQNAEVRSLISKAMPLLDGEPEQGFELEVIGGVGL